MGGICTAAETILAVGFIAEGITEVVLRQKIQALLDQHKEQFTLMDELNRFVEKLIAQDGLVVQLNTASIFSVKNWLSIVDDLEDKSQLLVEIIKKFEKVKSSSLNAAQEKGFNFSLSMFSEEYLAFNVAAKNIKAELSQDLQTRKILAQKAADQARSACPDFKSTNVTEPGTIQTENHGKDPQKMPAKSRQVDIEKIKSDEKLDNLKNKAALGMRIFCIVKDAYEFVQGVIDLIQLDKKLKHYREYFQQGGTFTEAEDGVILLMTHVASDLHNLTSCSLAALYDCKNMFYTKSTLISKYNDEVLEFASRINPEKIGLTDQFMHQTQGLVKKCNDINQSGKDRKDKLRDLKNIYKEYFDKFKPDGILLSITVDLSAITASYSLISDKIDEAQQNMTRFLTKVAEYFEQNRDQNFKDLPSAQKQKIDIIIMELTLERYCKIFQLDDIGMDVQKLDEETKSVLFSTIISLADQFYYDDLSGQSLFGKDIKDCKKQTSYFDLMDQKLSNKSNLIPISKSDQVDEQKQQEKWVTLAKQKNEEDKFVHFPENAQLKPIFRYLWLQVESFKNPVDDSESNTLQTYEGLKFKTDDGVVFHLEKKIMTGTLTIMKV